MQMLKHPGTPPVFKYKIPRDSPHIPLLSWLCAPGVADRFWSKVDRRSSDECWGWTGAKRVGKGYCDAHFKIDRYTTAIAPRCAYTLGYKADPGKSQVLHTCDNSLCCNPGHLYLGTQADNNRDTITRRRCPRRCKNMPPIPAKPGHSDRTK